MTGSETEEREETEGTERVVVDFFGGKAKTLYLIALFLSPFIAAGALCGCVFFTPLAARIVMLLLAAAGAGVFVICLITAKMRTSKWEADGSGVSYYAFGRRLASLSWEEMQEVGFLKITNPRSEVTAYYLYWTTEALMSACRDFIKGGEMKHKPKYLGKYNCKKGSIILYALDPHDPQGDPFLALTQRVYIHTIKNPRILKMAIEAAKEEQ